MRASFDVPALDAHSIDEEDLKEAARLSHGLTDMEDVRQATLERDGKISIVPWRNKRRMSKRTRIVIGTLIAVIIAAGAGARHQRETARAAPA